MTADLHHGFLRISVAVAILMALLTGCRQDGGSEQFAWDSYNRPSRLPAMNPELDPTVELSRMKDAAANHRLALMHDKKGECDKALAYYKAALKDDPDNADIHSDLGYSYYLQQRWKEAETSLRQAVSLNPNLAKAHNNLGLVLARTERHDEALREFAYAGCTQAETHANLAFALALEKRWEDAQRQFELALAADPASSSASEGLNALQSAARHSRRMRQVSFDTPSERRL